MRPTPIALALSAALLTAGAQSPTPAPKLPAPARPVAPIVSSTWSDERSRDHAGEADTVLHLAGVRRGMRVADVGAGEGYYTLKLATAVGQKGEVWAEDVVPGVVARLKRRVGSVPGGNVRAVLGEPDDPMLAPQLFDRVFMIHMYHEIAQPYALMWRVHDALKPDGLVVVVDSYRGTEQHGTPPALLKCELAAVGFREAAFHDLGEAGGYMAAFRAVDRPAPQSVRACGRGKPDGATAS